MASSGMVFIPYLIKIHQVIKIIESAQKDKT
jgi:hypothetical protein